MADGVSLIFGLAGYSEQTLQEVIDNKTDFENFFVNAPNINPNAAKITGVICGHRVEEIEDEIIRKVRYLDKLIDELAKGKAMEKISRKSAKQQTPARYLTLNFSALSFSTLGSTNADPLPCPFLFSQKSVKNNVLICEVK